MPHSSPSPSSQVFDPERVAFDWQDVPNDEDSIDGYRIFACGPLRMFYRQDGRYGIGEYLENFRKIRAAAAEKFVAPIHIASIAWNMEDIGPSGIASASE